MALPIIEIGKFNQLKVLKKTEQGLYLGDEVEEILLPNKYIPEGTEVGDVLSVFIYTDSEDRLIATTLVPKIQAGEFAYMTVKDISRVGAFLEWGLEKDLFVPFKEQPQKMEIGKSYLVYMYLDELTDRLVASGYVNKFLKSGFVDLKEGQQVNVLIGEETEIGYVAIINGKNRGLLYKNQIFQTIRPGDRTVAYVKRIRQDQRVDLSLERTGAVSIEPNAKRVFDLLQANDGFLPLHDNTDPEVIKKQLQMSKKNFKKAIGTLYKQRLIQIEEGGIRIIK